MIHAHDIREKIAAVLRREISLSALERWLGSESWNMFSDSPDAVPLVAAVNLLVSELHDHVINSDEFRSELVDLLNDINDEIAQPVEVIAPPSQRDWTVSASNVSWVNPPRLALLPV